MKPEDTQKQKYEEITDKIFWIDWIYVYWIQRIKSCTQTSRIYFD